MSATWTWRVASSSNVELITSPSHLAVHVGDFLGALVDQQDDERDLGMILRDRVRDLLQQDRLARARRRDDQPALALADRRDEIHDAHAEVAVARLEAEAPVGIARAQVVERDARLRRFRLVAVDASRP